MNARALAALERDVTGCRRCPRLVEWREAVAAERRAAFRDEEYWGRPIPGFGDPRGPIMILGLAPAAHGANRTGRVFTGDRSGDFLFAGLHRAGLANQPTSVHRDDGLALTGTWISAAVRCAPPANKPTPQERDTCVETWMRPEIAALGEIAVTICLGAFAWDVALRMRDDVPKPRPRFGHLAQWGSSPVLLGCFHPSQQNTFTGKLTTDMLDAVFTRAKAIAGL